METDFKRFYDATAGTYDQRHESPASRRLRKKENSMIRKFAEGKVLDIGCGTGCHMGHSWFKPAGIDITGVDISDDMLEIARKSGHDVRKARAESLPFSDKAFDTAFCFFAVLNMCDSSAVVREMARVLKPGGHALLSLSSIHDKRQFRISKQRVELKKLFSKEELIRSFERNGFQPVYFSSVFRSGRPRWGDFSPVPLRERISLWLDRFRDTGRGVIYLAAFKKRG